MSDHASSLRDLLKEESENYLETHDEPQQPVDAPADAPVDDMATEGPDSGRNRRRRSSTYDKMQRVEGRITTQQLRQLNSMRVTLMARRNRSGQRITNNSLIRIAIDGLMACQREINGNDEEELRNSYLQFLNNARDQVR